MILLRIYSDSCIIFRYMSCSIYCLKYWLAMLFTNLHIVTHCSRRIVFIFILLTIHTSSWITIYFWKLVIVHTFCVLSVNVIFIFHKWHVRNVKKKYAILSWIQNLKIKIATFSPIPNSSLTVWKFHDAFKFNEFKNRGFSLTSTKFYRKIFWRHLTWQFIFILFIYRN